MKEKLTFTTILFIALFAFGIIDVAYGDSTIIIPIRFHIVTGLSKEKDGLTMESWITKADIENTILPEVNRI